MKLQDFQAEGGDTYYQLTQGSYFADTNVLDCDSLIEYVQSLNGVIGQEYAKPQGRITIIKAAEEPVVEPTPEPTVEPAPSIDELYKVVKGDSLWKIADKELGNGLLWKEIYEANKAEIANPDKIYVGQEIVVK